MKAEMRAEKQLKYTRIVSMKFKSLRLQSSIKIFATCLKMF